MTIHCSANKEDIEKSVLMPGDPLRAKYIAENFLTDVKLVNSVRNMHIQESMEIKRLLYFLLEWACQVWEYIAMSYINFMTSKK